MGGDFACVGNQCRLELAGQEYFIDLLLFHFTLQCLVALELKVTEFKPEYVGKLNFYLSLLNWQVRKPHEQPSIGIIICQSKQRTVVKFARCDISNRRSAQLSPSAWPLTSSLTRCPPSYAPSSPAMRNWCAASMPWRHCGERRGRHTWSSVLKLKHAYEEGYL
jgi:hypothetical protein